MYEPASAEFDDPSEGIAAGTNSMGAATLNKLVQDPARMDALLEMARVDLEESRRTGETPHELMLREKREGQTQTHAAPSSETMQAICSRKPLYSLNRVAACLKLKLYTEVVGILAHPIELDYKTAKAHFRRGQAQRFLGHFDEAEVDLAEASLLQPNDPNILREMEELKKLEALGTKDKDAWIMTQYAQTVSGVFGEGQLTPLVNARLARG